MKPIPPVKPGDPITAELYNAVAERLEQKLALTVAQGGGLTILKTPRGRVLGLTIPRPIWAQLSGTSSPYSWQEVESVSGGTWAVFGQRAGTSNAYECNGKSGLGGKVVQLWKTSAGDWRFCWEGMGPRSCGGTGNVCATVVPTSCNTSGYSTLDYSGVAVTLKDAATPPNTIGTATTNSSGVACISYPKAIPLVVSATGDCGSASANVTGDCATDDVTLSLPGIAWTITYTNSDCGNTFSGATVTVTGPGTSYSFTWPFGSSPPWTFNLCGPVFGTYTIALADGTCVNGRTDNLVVASCTGSQTYDTTSKTFSLTGTIYNICSTASGGGYNGLAGATVTVSGAAGSGTTTTAADGSYTITGLKGGCAYSASVTKNCYVTATSSGTVGCGANVWSPTLGPDLVTNFCTNPCCINPTGTLTITDAEGTHTLSPGTLHASFTSPYIVKSGMSCTCYNFGLCNGGTFTSTIVYWYTLVCNGDGTWTCTRISSSCTGTDLGAATLSGGVPVAVADGATCANPGSVTPGLTYESQVLNNAAISCGPVSLSFPFTKNWTDTATVSDSSSC